MPDLSDLRALIHDHEAKDTGLTVDIAMLMKTWLTDELAELESEKADAERVTDGSMAGADTADIDGQITAKQAEIDAATITLHFKALTEAKYREVLREHPSNADTTDEQDAEFFAALTEKCYQGANWGGTEFTVADLPWDDIRAKLSFGEVAPIHGEVFAINRGNKSRRPLSSKPSKMSRRT